MAAKSSAVQTRAIRIPPSTAASGNRAAIAVARWL